MASTSLWVLEVLLEEGSVVKRAPFSVASIVEEGLARKRAGLPIPENRQFLFDSKNWDETVIILTHPKSGAESLIVTRDPQVIELARASYHKRFEAVGTWIRAHCEVRGNSSTAAPLFHVDRFIRSLDGFRGWHFKLDDQPGKFIVSKKLSRSDETARFQALEELGRVLDCLAVAVGVGVHTWHRTAGPIPREVPALSWGKEEQMLPEPTVEELHQIDAWTGSEWRCVIARALNQSYCEISKQAKLVVLWSACEQVFAQDPERMLSDEAVGSIVCCLASCEELADDADTLRRTQNLLADWLKKLAKKTRNDLIAEAIAPLLGVTSEESARRLRQAFGLRGRFSHSLSEAENAEVDESLAFLHAALTRALETNEA